MDKDSDLLPWILGGLSIASVAIAIAVGSTNRTAPKNLQAPSQSTAQALLEASALSEAAPVPVLAAEQMGLMAPFFQLSIGNCSIMRFSSPENWGRDRRLEAVILTAQPEAHEQYHQPTAKPCRRR
jgi:hypothetical protein